MKKPVVVVIILTILGFSTIILINTRRVNRYWNKQIEITISDSLNLHVSETNYLRGYLSFNQEFYILDAKVNKCNIELWEVTELNLPFTITKKNNNDTLRLHENGKVYYFTLKDK